METPLHDASSTRRFRAAALIAGLLCAAAAHGAPRQVGEVSFARGAVTAQVEGGGVRVLGKGGAILEGDVITSARRSMAVLHMRDGARMTVRPDSVLSLEEYSVAERRESALVRLFRGGLRAVTGFISKRNPDAYKVATSVATIGIRGTDFEARLCAQDCQEEAGRVRRTGTEPAAPPAVARLVFLRGGASALAETGAERELRLGASLYEGDTLVTNAGSMAVIAFRDRSRATLQPNTRFLIQRHRYAAGAPAEDRSLLRLVRGGLRFVTGLLGRRSPQALRMETPVATIGIRGTGFDLQCQGSCVRGAASGRGPGRPALDPVARLLGWLVPDATAQAPGGDGMFAYVWEGEIVLALEGGDLVLGQDEALFLPDARSEPIRLPAIPLFLRENPAPRPDRPESTDPGMPADPFEAQDQAQPEPGLYVQVFEGEVTVRDGEGGRMDLGPLETGWVNDDGTRSYRVAEPPRVIVTPDPRLFDDPRIQQIFRFLDPAGEDPQSEFECTVR